MQSETSSNSYTSEDVKSNQFQSTIGLFDQRQKQSFQLFENEQRRQQKKMELKTIESSQTIKISGVYQVYDGEVFFFDNKRRHLNDDIIKYELIEKKAQEISKEKMGEVESQNQNLIQQKNGIKKLSDEHEKLTNAQETTKESETSNVYYSEVNHSSQIMTTIEKSQKLQHSPDTFKHEKRRKQKKMERKTCESSQTMGIQQNMKTVKSRNGHTKQSLTQKIFKQIFKAGILKNVGNILFTITKHGLQRIQKSYILKMMELKTSFSLEELNQFIPVMKLISTVEQFIQVYDLQSIYEYIDNPKNKLGKSQQIKNKPPQEKEFYENLRRKTLKIQFRSIRRMVIRCWNEQAIVQYLDEEAHNELHELNEYCMQNRTAWQKISTSSSHLQISSCEKEENIEQECKVI